MIVVDPTPTDDPKQNEDSPAFESKKEVDFGAMVSESPPINSLRQETVQEGSPCKSSDMTGQQAALQKITTIPSCPQEALGEVNNQIHTESPEVEERKKNLQRTKPGKKTSPGLKQSLAGDPVQDFISELHEPVTIQSLALMYGVDLSSLKASMAKENDTTEYRMAEREMQVLEGIQKYLMDSRKQIHHLGGVFHVKISPLPCRILSVEQRRFENLLHSNHKSRHTYTNVGAGVLYRCPLPGCTGATLNHASVKRALLPHCRAYHNTDSLRFVFNIETKRGREALLFPPERDRIIPECTSSAPQDLEVPQADMQLTPLSQEPSEVTDSVVAAADKQKAAEGLRKSMAEGDITSTKGSCGDTEVGAVEVQQSAFISSDAEPMHPRLQEVSRGHSGTGVDLLSLTSGGELEAREYGIPNTHYATRKRGPHVTAPGLLMSRESEIVVRHGPSDAQREQKGNTSPRALSVQPPQGETGSRSVLEGFCSGGHLRTVQY